MAVRCSLDARARKTGQSTSSFIPTESVRSFGGLHPVNMSDICQDVGYVEMSDMSRCRVCHNVGYIRIFVVYIGRGDNNRSSARLR